MGTSPIFPVIQQGSALQTNPKTGAIELVVPSSTDYALKSDLPSISTVTPPAAALNGSVGSNPAYARADHTHEVKVQRTSVTTDASGQATWTFVKPFINSPVLSYMVVEASTILLPVQVKVIVKSTTSVTIQAVRLTLIPTVTIAGANIASGSAAGVVVDLFAAEPTQ